MNYILFDNQTTRTNLLPLTYLRPISAIRVGILTIREKWELYLGENTSTLTENYLLQKYPIKKTRNNILINASVCPMPEMVELIKNLKPNQSLICGDAIIAVHLLESDIGMINDSDRDLQIEELQCSSNPIIINYPWDIFTNNGKAIQEDFYLLTNNRKSETVSSSNLLISPENIFIEKGVKMEGTIINATNGPVYIGKYSEIMEGSLIRGPFALCEHSEIKMGAKIYGPTTIGPYSKVGGEVNNSVFFGYSNKAHDGFLGQSVIAEWCNIGADTNVSNLKNTYDEIRIWNYHAETFISTGLQFCGLIMGDHSKTGINTMLNTGTVVGVNVNIFGSGFPRNFVPSFSWGGASGFSTYDLKKAIKVAESVFSRRNKEFNEIEKQVLSYVYDLTINNRKI